MKQPRRCHTGEKYGAIHVGAMHCFKGSVFRYDIRWACCDRADVMNQAKLNVYRGNIPGQCIECRRAGKIPMNLNRYTNGTDRPRAGIELVETPWGVLQTLSGWSQDAHVARPWAFE